MKITGGKWRGRNIEAREDRSLRPTSSRIREVIFNLLQHGRFYSHEDYLPQGREDFLDGAVVLDIFCGTGALGMEALSRGAEQVIFVDQNAENIALVRKNVAYLKAEQQAVMLRSDSTQLPRARGQVDLVFIDPPYHQNLADPSFKSLEAQGWLKRGTLLILEGGKRDDPPDLPNFRLLDNRLYDKTRLCVLQYHG